MMVFKQLFTALVLCALLKTGGVYAQSGQLISAELGINGLTCSMCAKAVDEALRKLTFIKNVDMDVAATKASISFHPLSADIALLSIARAVRDAGFSVRSLVITVQLPHLADGCFRLAGNNYKLIGDFNKSPDGNVVLLLLNPDFLTSKAYKPWAEKIKSSGDCPSSGAYKEPLFWVAPL